MTHPWWQVTLEDQELETNTAARELPTLTQSSEDASDWSKLAEGDIGPPPFLKADLEYFLGGDIPMLGAEGGEDPWQDYLPKPYLEDSTKWVEWRADQIDTPEWWPELSAISGEWDTRVHLED